MIVDTFEENTEHVKTQVNAPFSPQRLFSLLCFILGAGCPSASSISGWEVSDPDCDSGPSGTYPARHQKLALVRRHFGKSGDSTSKFLSTLATIIFHFLSYVALESTSWMLGYLISHSLWVAFEGRHILFCTSCEDKPVFGILRQALWQTKPETGDRCLNFMKACLKLEYIQIWQRHLREMLLVCGSLLNGQRCFHHCCDLSKKQQQNTLHLNCPFASWAFPLSTVFLCF